MPHPSAAEPAADVVVLVAHPSMEQSRVNRRLLEAALGAGHRVAVRNLYRLYPDYLIDVAAEQATLASARLVVWQHPLHWYGPPPLMKLWIGRSRHGGGRRVAAHHGGGTRARAVVPIGLSVLAERNLMSTSSGQSILSVALLQDVAAIPILALVPLLGAGRMQATDGGSGWAGGLWAVAVIGVIVLGGRLLLRPALRWIARSRTPEIFTAASLLVVVATSALMQTAGLPMGLGAFLAGVLLAESEYRRELDTDLEPFRGLLLGLFFIAVGMSIDFDVVMRQPGQLLLLVAGFLVLQAAVLWAMSRARVHHRHCDCTHR